MIRQPMAFILNPLHLDKDPPILRLMGEGRPIRMRLHVLKAQSQRPKDSCRHTRETSDNGSLNKDHHWARLKHHRSLSHMVRSRVIDWFFENR